MMVLLLFLPFSQTLMPQPIDSSSPWQRSKAPTLNPKPQENQLPNDASDKPVNPEGLCAHIVRVLPHRVAVYTRGQIKSFVYICVYIYIFICLYIYIYITVIITFIHVHMCIYIYINIHLFHFGINIFSLLQTGGNTQHVVYTWALQKSLYRYLGAKVSTK